MTVRRNSRRSPYWHYDFWYRGRRYRGSTKKTAKARAEEYERRVRHELETGHDPFFRSPPIQDLFERYLSWLETNNKSPQHIDRARRGLRNVFERMRNVRVAGDITRSRVEDFKARRRGEARDQTVNLELRYLRAFLRRAVKEGWLASLPVEVELIQAGTQGRLVFLTADEIPLLLAKLPPWAREAAHFILRTGLRLNESRFLEWEDIDLTSGELKIRDKPLHGFSPKSRRERSVALPPDLIEELLASKREKGWVLQGAKGGQLDRRTFQVALAQAGKAAGLSKAISPHVLRHTYGSYLVMSGVDIQTVKDLMGHSTITTTAIYLHTDPKHRREAVAKLKIPGVGPPEEKVVEMHPRKASGD